MNLEGMGMDRAMSRLASLIVCALVVSAVDVKAAGATGAEKPEVKITKDTAAAFDPKIHARVVDDMADGQESSALQPPYRIAFRIPRYPKSAAKAGVQGVVEIEARVGTNGKVEEFIVHKGHEELVDAVKAAVSKWRYKPLKLDGIPYDIKINVEVTFSLR